VEIKARKIGVAKTKGRRRKIQREENNRSEKNTREIGDLG